MGSIGNVANSNMVSVIHYTDEANIDSLLNNGFDFSRSGEVTGNTWGSGAYYLKKGSYEDDLYSIRLDTDSYIQSDIDTSDYLKINTLNTHAYRSTDKMYDDAAKSFNGLLHREYTSLKNRLKREGNDDPNKEAFTTIAKRHYSGLIVQHKVNGGTYIDPTTGGNQIVVYNQNTIKSKKKGQN